MNDIPPGPKENVFVIVQRTMADKLEFPDDCGVWGHAETTVNSTLIAYRVSVDRKIQNQRHYIPL